MISSRRGRGSLAFALAILVYVVCTAGCTGMVSAASRATLAKITISPASGSLSTGGTLQLKAVVHGSDKTVTWTASIGTISSSGFYTAPATPGIATVSATSKADPSKSATATVTIISAPTATVTSVTITPTSAASPTAGTIQFTAAVQGTAADKSVSWNATSGTITSSGLFRAPSTQGTATITATSNADPSKTASATVSVSVASTYGSVSSVAISPASASSVVGGTLPFTAKVQGTTSNTGVTWKAALGTISSSGNYTSPASAGTDTVTARSNADPTKFASAIVTVHVEPPPVPVITSLTAVPMILQPGQSSTIQWTVVGASTLQLSGVPAISGSSANVMPSQTTTYTLTATNTSGSVSQSVTVEVTGATQPFELGPEFFGFSMSPATISDTSRFPSVPFGTMRVTGSGVDWRSINSVQGTFSFKLLDEWLALAQTNNKDVLLTLGRTPQWASMRPTETCAGGLGCAAPPSDVATGDNLWKAYITAVVNHSNSSATAKIHYYEIWNEADGGFWTGTNAQMLTLAKDAYAIIHALDPTAKVLTPSISSCCGTGKGFTWMSNYFAAGGAAADAQDIVSLHAYPSGTTPPEPTNLLGEIDQLRGLMGKYGIASEPIWFTEGAWNGSHATTMNDAQQVAWVGQQYLYMWMRDISRYYWFQWDNQTFGTMWSSSGGVKPVGVAYGELYTWLTETTHAPNPCTQASDGTWTCNLSKLGVPRQIYWNTGTTVSVPISSTYTHYQTLDGPTINNISGQAISVGSKPIMVTP